MKKKIAKPLHFIIFAVYCLFFFLNIPTYCHLKFLGWSGPQDDIWVGIRNFVISSDILFYIYKQLINLFSEFEIMLMVLINAVNMIFGFIMYKKKWWYYIMLTISILISIVLLLLFDMMYWDSV